MSVGGGGEHDVDTDVKAVVVGKYLGAAFVSGLDDVGRNGRLELFDRPTRTTEMEVGHGMRAGADNGERHGRVLIAGSDVAAHFPGWIAGAIFSGRAAAQEALELLTT